MPIGEIAVFAGFGVAIVVSMGLLYGHRVLARRLVRDPAKRPEGSVELAAFWPPITLSAIFPILALANIDNVYAYELGRWMMVGFFGAGTVWLWAVSRWQWYLRYAANQTYVVSMGSRDHGETPEMYQTAFRKAVPWAASIVTVSFVISLVQAWARL
jgi:hypothetical protein